MLGKATLVFSMNMAFEASVVQILGRTDRTHSKLVRDFSKKLLTGIFGCPKLHVGQKKLKKKRSYFFHFS